MPLNRGAKNDSGIWLQFTNRNSLSEERIRSLFEKYGGIKECDGAVNGPSDGWVMISMDTMDKASSAIKGMRESGNPIGETLSLINPGSVENGMGGSESEANLAENVKIVTKRPSQPRDHDKFENPNSFVGSNDLLSSSDIGDVGGMKNLTAMYSKILEITSHNNNLLISGMRETVEDCNRQLKEKDDQIRRLQNILTNHEENIRKLTNKLSSNQDLEAKVKSFFGENEEFYKKKAHELTKQNQDLSKKLAESEKSRFERVLEESDTSRVKAEVEKLTGLSDNILSKTEQVFAVVQGMDMGGVVRSDGKGELKMDSMSGNTALLHNKIDKSIRILAETSENQKKMNKVLQDLIKYTGLMRQDSDIIEVEDKKKKKKDKERDRSRGRKRSRSRSTEKRRRSRSGSGERLKMQQVMPPASIDHEFEEMKWGLNMTLIGDGHWKSLVTVDDIKNIVDRMGKKVNFRVMCNENETLASMYEEERDSLMVALPKTCYKVGISIGSNELNDPSLITLKDAPMDEVRRRNEPKLNKKARILKELVLNLIRQNKMVIVMIPPYGETRMEVHGQWEEILLNKLGDIRFPSIKILNMAKIMRGTMSEYSNNAEYLDMWLRQHPKPRRTLSPYGTRRMFHALRQTVTSKTPQQAGMDNWPTPQSHPPPPQVQSQPPAPLQQLQTPPPIHAQAPHQSRMSSNVAAIAQPRQEDFPCPRCTRTGHPQDKCKSRDKVCRKCNLVGHFVEVHEITDERFRQVITSELGYDLWESRGYGGYEDSSRVDNQDYKRSRQDNSGQYYGGRGDHY